MGSRGGPQGRGGYAGRTGPVSDAAAAPERPLGGPRREGVPRPELPEDVTGAELDRDVRAQLASLGAYSSKEVARHLVMAGRLIDEDPELAWQHAVAARARGARIWVVREAVGLAAYRAGRFAEALAELRTVRRLTGSNEHLPVMADCERGLGRPLRALALASDDEASTLDQAGRIELRIVAAGARADLGQLEAAVVTLQVPELQSKGSHPWLARLRSAYADALEAVGRQDEARVWLERAAEADETGETGAELRLAELDGLVLFDDLDELDDVEEAGEPDGFEAAEVVSHDIVLDEVIQDGEVIRAGAGAGAGAAGASEAVE